MIESFKRYICSNCKGQCDKGIVTIVCNGMKQMKCVDYEKKNEVKGYVKPKERTAKQKKAIMGFTQED